jgi:hypothetical protein
MPGMTITAQGINFLPSYTQIPHTQPAISRILAQQSREQIHIICTKETKALLKADLET